MKKKIDMTMLIGTMICLAPILLGLAVYSQLPEQIAIHWNSSGAPDNYFAKPLAVFALPVALAVINMIVNVVINNDPKRANISPKMKILSKWAVPALAVIVQPVTLFIAMGANIPIQVIAPAIVGILIIVAGNYLPKSRQNYTTGIKLPWTLSSEENWNKTHRLAGYVWIMGGSVILISAFLNWWFVAIAAIFLLALIPIVYSFVLYKKAAVGK